jgi:transcriptional regulator with XRE-family HTH domain
MDISLLIRQRLNDLGLGQKDLAAAADVTESYISQLLTRKKAPPAPGRTDIYEKIGRFLELPDGELAKLAEAQRQHELRKKVAESPGPLFRDCRELILRKCAREIRTEVRRIFEKEAFGELERLITQTILEVAQGLAREELRGEEFLRSAAEIHGLSYEQARVAILDFLDTDVFHISAEACVSFLDPTIDSWKIDLRTFSMEIKLDSRLGSGTKRFEYMEKPPDRPLVIAQGLEQFLKDKSLSGGATDEEVAFLQTLTFKGRQFSPLYYYRALRDLRDPLHFEGVFQPTETD